MTVLILTNHQSGLYRFRRELLEKLVADGHKVYASVPEGEFTRELESVGVEVLIDRFLDRRGMNPVKDLKLVRYYKTLLKRTKPDVVLTYTVKPNVYGGFLCGKAHIPYIANVTGLGTSIENSGLTQKIILTLYRIGLKRAAKVFFQNHSNLDFMLDHKVVTYDKTDVLPGSGVNTDEHAYLPYPTNDEKILFTTIGRIMRDKGIDDILTAAREIKSRHNNVIFRLIGDYDGDYKEKVEEYQAEGTVEYIPFKKDIIPYIGESHAIIHASYHEGMSNVLLEAASSGRPVIASNVPGCIETFEPGITGIAFEAKKTDSLVNAIDQFLSMSYEQKEQMGKAGREKMVKEFDRNLVVQKYMDQIGSITKR